MGEIVGEHLRSFLVPQPPFPNIAQQDQRSINRIIRPLLGFHSFQAAYSWIVGIELMRMIKKGQMVGPENEALRMHLGIHSDIRRSHD